MSKASQARRQRLRKELKDARQSGLGKKCMATEAGFRCTGNAEVRLEDTSAVSKADGKKGGEPLGRELCWEHGFKTMSMWKQQNQHKLEVHELLKRIPDSCYQCPHHEMTIANLGYLAQGMQNKIKELTSSFTDDQAEADLLAFRNEDEDEHDMDKSSHDAMLRHQDEVARIE